MYATPFRIATSRWREEYSTSKNGDEKKRHTPHVTPINITAAVIVEKKEDGRREDGSAAARSGRGGSQASVVESIEAHLQSV